MKKRYNSQRYSSQSESEIDRDREKRNGKRRKKSVWTTCLIWTFWDILGNFGTIREDFLNNWTIRRIGQSEELDNRKNWTIRHRQTYPLMEMREKGLINVDEEEKEMGKEGKDGGKEMGIRRKEKWEKEERRNENGEKRKRIGKEGKEWEMEEK